MPGGQTETPLPLELQLELPLEQPPGVPRVGRHKKPVAIARVAGWVGGGVAATALLAVLVGRQGVEPAIAAPRAMAEAGSIVPAPLPAPLPATDPAVVPLVLAAPAAAPTETLGVDGAQASTSAVAAVSAVAAATPALIKPAPGLRPAAPPRAKPTAGTPRAAAGAVATAPAATGTLQLAISPWGQVEVNGRPAGTTPPLARLTLPEGSHTITVRNVDFPPYTTTVQVQADKPLTLRHRFTP